MIRGLIFFLFVLSISSCATQKRGEIFFESIIYPTTTSAYVIEGKRIDTLMYKERIEENFVLGLAKIVSFSYNKCKPCKIMVAMDSLEAELELPRLPNKPAIIIDYVTELYYKVIQWFGQGIRAYTSV